MPDIEPVIPPDEVKPDWTAAGRRLDRDGAGGKPKIYQFSGLSTNGRHYALKPADDQAALALAQRAADETGEPWILARTAAGNLIAGSHGAMMQAGEGLGAQFVLETQPGVLGNGGSITLSQARDLISSDDAREAAAGVLAAIAGLADSAADAAADAVLQAIVGLLPAERKNLLPWPGWRIRPELMPEIANLEAERQSDTP